MIREYLTEFLKGTDTLSIITPTKWLPVYLCTNDIKIDTLKQLIALG